MKLRFTAIEPLFETSALIDWPASRLHLSRRLTLGFFDRFVLFGFGLASEQTFDFFVGNRIEVDCASCFRFAPTLAWIPRRVPRHRGDRRLTTAI